MKNADSWVQVIPDPDEPVVHLYAEAATDGDVAELRERFARLIHDTLAGIADDQAGADAQRAVE